MYNIVVQEQIYLRVPCILDDTEKDNKGEHIKNMKKYLLILLIALLLISGACANTAESDEELAPPSTETVVVSPESTPTQTPAIIHVPDFVGTDFSGTWYVGELIDSNGDTVGEDEMQTMGAVFSIELLFDSTYFVYDETGDVLGQGTYCVKLNCLTLTAADEDTIYEIQDEDTFCCTLEDSSITVMKRAEETADAETSDIGDEGDTDIQDEDGSGTLDDEETF